MTTFFGIIVKIFWMGNDDFWGHDGMEHGWTAFAWRWEDNHGIEVGYFNRMYIVIQTTSTLPSKPFSYSQFLGYTSSLYATSRRHTAEDLNRSNYLNE
jgi:hypothetical protein